MGGFTGDYIFAIPETPDSNLVSYFGYELAVIMINIIINAEILAFANYRNI